MNGMKRGPVPVLIMSGTNEEERPLWKAGACPPGGTLDHVMISDSYQSAERSVCFRLDS
jgi:hypothetical protein